MFKKYVCERCGYWGSPKTKVKGNASLEILLWIFFLIPGFIYSLWRSTQAYKVCSHCGSEKVYLEDSYEGKEIIAKHNYKK